MFQVTQFIVSFHTPKVEATRQPSDNTYALPFEHTYTQLQNKKAFRLHLRLLYGAGDEAFLTCSH